MSIRNFHLFALLCALVALGIGLLQYSAGMVSIAGVALAAVGAAALPYAVVFVLALPDIFKLFGQRFRNPE